jgi:hypothetical protein
VKLTIDPPPIAMSSNVNLGISFETVDIDGDIQSGGYLAIDGPDKLLAAHTAALEHVMCFHLREVEGQTFVGLRPVAVSPRSISTHATTPLIEIACISIFIK